MYSKTQIPEGGELVNGVFHQIIRPVKTDFRPVLFLDRDGCIVVETDYGNVLYYETEELTEKELQKYLVERNNFINLAI